MTAPPRHGAVGGATSATGWATFGVIAGAYLSVTVAESLLAPLYPALSEDLGLDLASAGQLFALLTAAIAVGNIAGGYLLARRGPRASLVAGPLVAAAGAALAASSSGPGTFVVSQALLGLGAGGFFAPGLNAIGLVVERRRRGKAIGLFGVAFSAGLAVAAGIAAAGGAAGWRLGFWVTAACCLAAAVTLGLAPLPPRRADPVGGLRRPIRDVFGLATMVGAAGSVSQYGTVAFLPAFAVAVWGMTPAQAALMLAVARVLSILAKLVAGAASDRWGARATVRGLGVVLVATGAWWTAGGGVDAVAAAVVFAATVSAVFPVANLLALDDFEDRGPLLGTYRAAQIAVGALAAFLIGVVAHAAGLRVALASSVVVPLVLVGVRARRSLVT